MTTIDRPSSAPRDDEGAEVHRFVDCRRQALQRELFVSAMCVRVVDEADARVEDLQRDRMANGDEAIAAKAKGDLHPLATEHPVREKACAGGFERLLGALRRIRAGRFGAVAAA